MPLEFLIWGNSTSSNKPHIGPEKAVVGTIEVHKLGYRYEIAGGTHKGARVYLTRPFIDKLSLTYHVLSLELQVAVKDGLIDLAKAGILESQSIKRSRYALNLKLMDADADTGILISAAPHKKSGPKDAALVQKPGQLAFLRFELNPERISRAAMASLAEVLYIASGGQITVSQLRANANITRLDVAVDILNLSINQLLIGNRAGKKSFAYFGTDSRLESHYSDKSTSPRVPAKVIVYNKTQGQIDKGIGVKFPHLLHTRVEVKVTGTQKTLGDLWSLSNPLRRAKVFLPDPVVLPVDRHAWEHFLDSCRFRGVKAALDLVPQKLRKKYEQALLPGPKPLWRPDELWAMWPKSIARYPLINPAPSSILRKLKGKAKPSSPSVFAKLKKSIIVR